MQRTTPVHVARLVRQRGEIQAAGLQPKLALVGALGPLQHDAHIPHRAGAGLDRGDLRFQHLGLGQPARDEQGEAEQLAESDDDAHAASITGEPGGG